MKDYVLSQLHDSRSGGHLGVNKTYSKINERYFWYKCKSDVKKWCRNCDKCAARKSPAKLAKSPMQVYNVGAPMERWAIDVLGPLPRSNSGNLYLLVVGDYFTKWIDAIPIRDQKANTVAKKFVERIVTIFGTPMQLHSDQGTNFESEVFREMCKILGIEKTRTTPHHPQSDGMIERANRTIENMLSAFVSKNTRDWDEHIYLLMMAYRAAKHESIGISPCKMVFGRDIFLPIDLVLGRTSPVERYNENTYANKLTKTLEIIHDFARDKLQLTSDNMRQDYDKKILQNKFNLADLVWYFNPQSLGKGSKLKRPWTGPYTIVKIINNVVYCIQKSPKSKVKTVHHNYLKPYIGSDTLKWYRPK